MAISYGVTAPPKTYNPGARGAFGGGTRPVKPGAPTGHYTAPPVGLRGPASGNGIYLYGGGGGVTAPPQQYNPGARTIAGSFVGGAAQNGAPWARQLQKSPWAGHGPNTAAGWQAAGYGNPQKPVAPPAPPHNSATTQTPADPRDSAYYANVAANQFKINNQQNAIGEQGGYAAVDLQNALAKLAYQQPRDELKAEQAANSRGGLYSSVYNQQLGDLAHAYQDNQFNAQQAFDRGEAARAAQTSALEGSVPLYNAQQYAAATIRAANQASQDKSLGESGSR